MVLQCKLHCYIVGKYWSSALRVGFYFFTWFSGSTWAPNARFCQWKVWFTIAAANVLPYLLHKGLHCTACTEWKAAIILFPVPPAMNTHVHSKQVFPLEGILALSQELSAFLEPEALEKWIKCFNISPLCSKIDILKMERSNCTNFSPLTQSATLNGAVQMRKYVLQSCQLKFQNIEKRQMKVVNWQLQFQCLSS